MEFFGGFDFVVDALENISFFFFGQTTSLNSQIISMEEKIPYFFLVLVRSLVLSFLV